jgi:hypothetical protein
MMPWYRSDRADRVALPLADRHYNRQSIGSPQFVPPGRCLVLVTADADALWVTSAPIAAYVKHAWAGAWVNSLFRNESRLRASDLIRSAVAATCAVWTPPPFGLVSFVDPSHVAPTHRRGATIYGYCYLKAGFSHVGFTKGGLWVWQLLPEVMPAPMAADNKQLALFRY